MWQPIETAPRDRLILAYNPVMGIYTTAYTTRWTGLPEEYENPDYEGFPCGFCWSGPKSYPFGQWDCQPTHWCELPPEPHQN